MKSLFPVSLLAASVAVLAVTHSAQSFAEAAVMTAASGMTVYTFDKDQAGSGMSACDSECAPIWPPVPVTAVPKGAEFSAVSRDDGTMQAAHQGKPLYFYIGDKKPGDMAGDKIGNIWHAVPLSGASIAARPASPVGDGSYSY